MPRIKHVLSPVDVERLLGTTPAHFCKTTADGMFLWLSPRWPELLRMDEQQIMAKPFTAHIHPDDLERTREAMARLDQGEPVVNFSNRYRRGDGSYIWLRWFAKGEDGFYYGVATEQGGSRDPESRLSESLHLLELTEELGQIGHWRVDLRANTLHWSNQIYRIHGLDPNTYEPALESAIEAYHPEDRSKVEEHISRAVETKTGFDFELRLLRADGEVRDVVSKGRVECDEGGEVTSLIGMFQDVTDSKRLQTRLQESDRLHSVSTLAAGVAHEINNPLQFITSSLSLALDQLEGASDRASVRELLEEAQSGVDQVAQVVRDLRSFVKWDEKSIREPVDLRAVLDTTLNMIRSQARRRAELSVNVGDVPMVSGRYTELVQVFVNLFTNAFEALGGSQVEKPEVRMTALTRADGWAVVEVEDNGPGIAAETITRLFEPFFSTKQLGQGTGLGLYVSRSIVHRHGGTLTAESAPGRTCFRVALPATDQGERGDAEPERSSLLIVDDDKRVIKALSKMLSREYRVVAETDPSTALARVRSGQHFDVLLLDVMMPGMDGWQLLSAMGECDPALLQHTLMMTGAVEVVECPAHLQSVPMISKPFKLEELLPALAGLRQARP